MTDTERLNALFEEWLVPDEKYYYEVNKNNDNAPKYNPKVFVKDGIVDEESYKRQDKKILFVLKEAYLKDKGGIYKSDNEDHDVREWLKDKNMAHNRGILSVSPATWRRIMEWTYGIRHTDETVSAEFPDEIYIKTDREYDVERFITEFFGTIAVMNIKKSYGRSISKNYNLTEYAREFKTQLKKEIEIISPDIIVCCGTANMLNAVYDGEIRKALNSGDHCIFPKNGRTIVIKTCHPANRHVDKKYMFNAVVNAYRQALKGE